MTDPREDFEYEHAKESDFTESRMRFMRAKDSGYQHRELDLIYKGWRLAKTQRIRAALRREAGLKRAGGDQ